MVAVLLPGVLVDAAEEQFLASELQLLAPILLMKGHHPPGRVHPTAPRDRAFWTPWRPPYSVNAKASWMSSGTVSGQDSMSPLSAMS